MAAGSYEIDSVVWLDLSKYNYTWWPCRVDSVDGRLVYTAFGDAVSYDPDNFKSDKVRDYNCEELSAMIAKGKKKLGKRTKTLFQYSSAIADAVQYIKSEKDSDFSVDKDILEDISALSNSAEETPRSNTLNLRRLTKNSVYTDYGESGSGSDYDWMNDLSPTLTSSERSSKKRGRKRNTATKWNENVTDKNGSLTGSENMIQKRPKQGSPMENTAAPMRLNFDLSPCPAHPALANYTRCRDTVLSYDPLLASIPNTHPPASRRKGIKTTADWENDGSSRCGHVERREKEDTPTSPLTAVSKGSRLERKIKKTTGIRDKTPPTQNVSTPTRTPSTRDVSPQHVTPPTRDVSPQHVTPPTQDVSPLPPSPSQPASPSHPLSPSGDMSSSPSPNPSRCLNSTWGSRFYGFSDSDMDLKSEEEEEEDDLPSVHLEANESIKIHELKVNDVVWAKERRYPYWPALVTSVRTQKKNKSKARASVLFFGYNDTPAFKISKDKNVALFGTKQFKEYADKGNASKYAEHFAQAMGEAQYFVGERAEGTFTGTPKEMFRKMVAQRKISHIPHNSFMADIEGESSMDAKESSYCGPSDETHSSSDSELEDEEDDEEEEPDTIYTYDRVQKEIESIRPELVGIVKGEVRSFHHSTYMSGSKKELKKLQLGQKYGPIKKWNKSRVNDLIDDVLIDIVREVGILGNQKSEFKYAYDVLLPEAMVRVKARVENISLEQAFIRFESCEND